MNFYNHHYLLSKEHINCAEGYFTRQLPLHEYTLCLGADVNFLEVKHNNSDVTFWVIGEFFSVKEPDLSMEQLLVSAPSNRDVFLDLMDDFVGVFLIFKRSATGTFEVYTDATAIYKCFYLVDHLSEILSLSSDPLYLSIFCGAEKDNSPEALDYYSSKSFLNFPHRVGNLTSYKNVFQLLPNHSLDFVLSKVSRIFPRSKIEVAQMESVAEKLSYYFNNIITQLAKKYDVKVALTAGWDSRMILAATLLSKDEIEYYTYLTDKIQEGHVDITLPRDIAKSLNLNYRAIQFKAEVDQRELRKFQQFFELVPQLQIDFILRGTVFFNDWNQVVLEGTVSEIAKNYYDDVQIRGGDDLCKAAHYSIHPYTKPYFQAKYEELKLIEQDLGYDLRDIAHWEQDITNFAGQNTFLKQSVSHVIPPFNSKRLLVDLLSVNRYYRDKQNHVFYNFYLDQYAPQLSKYKVNSRFKIRVIRFMKKVGIYASYKNLVNKL